MNSNIRHLYVMFVNGEFDVSDELNEMSVTAYAIFLIKPHDLSSLA